MEERCFELFTCRIEWRNYDLVRHIHPSLQTTPWMYQVWSSVLGQKLHLTDPEPPPDPLPTESAWRNADYPEWMCEEQNALYLYGQFNQWPDACQKRYLQDLDKPLKDLFGWGGKEESPAKVSILVKKSLPPNPHGLPDGGSTYAANSMRSFALTSTAKDDDDEEPIRIHTRAPRWQFNDLDRFEASQSLDNFQV